MSTESVQYRIRGDDAASLVRSIERGVATGALAPGDTVPSVRALAREVGLSPTTVAAAYRDLRQRGVLVTHDRSRTVVGHRPPVTGRLAPALPPDVRDLASGNPDPALLPDLRPALTALAAAGADAAGGGHRLYGEEPGLDALLELARAACTRDGLPGDHLAVVAGGLDGVERVLEVHLRVGDAVAVEDPGYIGSLDLVRALGLRPVPVAVDDEGPTAEGLEAALAAGVEAFLLVPRAQNPTGAALTDDRAAALGKVLATHPDVLVVEDDHAGAVAGAPARTLVTDRARWASVRSVAKSLGPDLRVAWLTGDEDTVARVLGRQRLGTGWVSSLLQRLTVEIWSRAEADGTLAHATATYAARRAALRDALAAHDLTSSGSSGLNVWVPVPEEVPVVQGLLARGWGVQAGEPYRLEAEPGIRVTVASLDVAEAPALAADLAAVLDDRLGTRRG